MHLAASKYVHLNGIMTFLYVVFTRPLPFVVNLNGRMFEVSVQTGMKSGMLAVIAQEVSGRKDERKWYVLTAGKIRDVEADIHYGIKIPAHSARHGLATAMKRARVATLSWQPCGL